jgi:hypothetical protein
MLYWVCCLGDMVTLRPKVWKLRKGRSCETWTRSQLTAFKATTGRLVSLVRRKSVKFTSVCSSPPDSQATMADPFPCRKGCDSRSMHANSVHDFRTVMHGHKRYIKASFSWPSRVRVAGQWPKEAGESGQAHNTRASCSKANCIEAIADFACIIYSFYDLQNNW